MRERLNLLRRHQRFFTAYRGRFADVLLKIANLLLADDRQVDEDLLRQQSLSLYDHLFSVEAHTPTLRELEESFHQLEGHGISLTVLLGKGFAMMLHDFVRYAMRSGSVVLPVRQLSGVMSAVLAQIDTLEESPLEAVIDEEQGRIFESLAKHGDQILSLESLYQGVPLSMSVLFIAREGDQALLQCADERQPRLETGHEVMLSADFLERPLIAEVERLDLNRHEFLLSRFHYAAHADIDRSELRVQPREIMGVTVRLGETTIDGQVIDISLSGMAIAVDDPATIEEGGQVEIELNLPHHGTPEKATLRGRVNRLTARRSSHRIGIALLEGGDGGGLLGEYLIARQAEVLRHVNNLASDEENLERQRRRKRADEDEWPWLRYLVGIMLVVVLLLIGSLVYLYQPDEKQGRLEWQATQEWLSQQKLCQELATQFNLQPNDANRIRLERCQQDLKRLAEPARQSGAMQSGRQ